VRPGRARPGAAYGGLATFLLGFAAWTAFGPRGFLPLVLVAGIYLLGPLWTAVRYEVDDAGIERATPFGARRLAWDAITSWRVDRALRSAWITPKGRGSARFLPPLLLLWEPGPGAEAFGVELEKRLVLHLGGVAREG